MRLPPVIRYLPARLAPLANPLLWMPILTFGFIGIFTWEYITHPDWLAWSSPDYETTSDIGLTPEEEGGIAELDNVAVLLNETRSLVEPEQPNDSIANLPESAESDDTTDSSTLTRLNEYFNQYGLNRGVLSSVEGATPSLSNNVSSNAPQSTALSAIGSTIEPDFLVPNNTFGSSFGGGQGSNLGPITASESILTSAIKQVDSVNRLPSSEANSIASPNAVEGDLSSNNPGLPGQQGVVRGSLPGIAGVSFIRTTPMMSPPPGTTGYTPPTSLGLSTFQQSFSQFSSTPPEPNVVTPSAQLRQPQRPDNVLPGENAYQLPTSGSIAAPIGATIEPEVNVPINSWDSFWGGS